MENILKLFNFCSIYLILILLLQSGCTNKIGLSGKVIFDDGQPLRTGMVCFENPTYIARGTLKSDGSYTVGSLSEKDGLPAGKYNVYITGAEKEIDQTKSGEPIMESLIDLKFINGNTSGLNVNVSSSTRTFNINVTKYIPKKK